MSASYLSACADRLRDETLHRLIVPRMVEDSGCWRIEHRDAAGRSLVASKPIPAGTRVFIERPVVVAPGGAAAVAKAILQLDRDGDEFAAACQLQGQHMQHATRLLPTDESNDGWAPWAAGVARVNVHGAGGTPVDPAAGRRAVLCLLGSMMQHECCPSCVTNFSNADEGTLLSLHTVRDLDAGELLSISYCASYQTTERRRELLQMQHKFLCECRRCTTLPEDVRAFRCPNCGEGPCSPTTSAPDCRDLFCDACECVMQLDDEAWKGLTDAEACETVSQEMLSVLHPYHHKPTLMYMLNLLKLPPSSRASFLRQHADARQRLYAHFCAPGLTSAMVANDIEAAAVAHLAGGELDEAAEAFTDAAGRFETFYGVGSQNALRCHKAAGAKTLDLYIKIGGEVNAHH